MINVRVLFLARLRDLTGRREFHGALDDGTIAGLRALLATQFQPEIIAELFAGNVRVAVNQAVWDGSTLLEDGDEVAFLPPVTGG